MRTLRRDALFHIVGLSIPIVAIASVAPGSTSLTLACWTALACAVFLGLRGHGHARFGPANALTLARAGSVAVLMGLLTADPVPLEAAAAIALLALVTDGIDGKIARSTRLTSPFGARFDMEVDALLMLVLAILAVAAGRAGAWALALGMLRYAWVAAGQVWPAFSAPLPPSERRRVCCGAAILLVIVALALPVPFAEAACAGALGMLIFSFAVDLRSIITADRS
jgi:phosphatidylglycerophosphate synthase